METTNNIQAPEQIVQSMPLLSPEQESLFREMIAAGVAVGRKKSKTNPRMDKFIFTYTKGIAVFDVAQTLALTDAAAAFLKNLLAEKKQVLVISSQPAGRDLAQRFAKKHGFHFVTTRWLGGMLTNFKTISQRIEYFKKLKADKASGVLEKYTKKECLAFDRLISNMDYVFSGVENMTAVPAALMVIDALAHDTAVREAKRLGIPIVAIMNNDNDATGIHYPIPANDNTRSSVGWILERIDNGLV